MNEDYFALNSAPCFYVHTLILVIAGQSNKPVSIWRDFGHDKALVRLD